MKARDNGIYLKCRSFVSLFKVVTAFAAFFGLLMPKHNE